MSIPLPKVGGPSRIRSLFVGSLGEKRKLEPFHCAFVGLPRDTICLRTRFKKRTTGSSDSTSDEGNKLARRKNHLVEGFPLRKLVQTAVNRKMRGISIQYEFLHRDPVSDSS